MDLLGGGEVCGCNAPQRKVKKGVPISPARGPRNAGIVELVEYY